MKKIKMKWILLVALFILGFFLASTAIHKLERIKFMAMQTQKK